VRQISVCLETALLLFRRLDRVPVEALAFADAVGVHAVGVLFVADVTDADVVVVVLFAGRRGLDADGAVAALVVAGCGFAVQQVVAGFVALYPAAVHEARLTFGDGLHGDPAFGFVEHDAEHRDDGDRPGEDFPADVEVGKDAQCVGEDRHDGKPERGYRACEYQAAFVDAGAAQALHAVGHDLELDRAALGGLGLGDVDVVGVAD